MADTFSQQERSRIMRAVKSTGNKSTEVKLIQLFKQHHIKGWRRNYKLPGKPDFVFPKQRLAVFADGCFWHGHECRNTKPVDNASYWQTKIERNKKRDKEITQILINRNWHVIRIWECEIKQGNMQKFRDVELL